MKDKYPKRDIMPAWYELATKDEDTLVVRIHTKAMEELIKTVKSDSPIVQSYKEKFSKKNPFILPRIGKAWGFGEILILQKTDEP